MPYPAIFLGGCQFFDESSKEKNQCAAGESGEEEGARGAVSYPQWGSGVKPSEKFGYLHSE